MAGQQIIGSISLLGYPLFLFLTGVKMNIGMILNTGTKAMTIGIATLLVPFLCGIVTKQLLGRRLSNHDKDELSIVFITQSILPFPVISSLLTELSIFNSELGRLGLSAAMVSDSISFSLTVSFILFTIFMESFRQGLIHTTATIAFLVVVVFVIRPMMFVIIRRTPEGRPVKDVYVYISVVLTLASCLLSNTINYQFNVGPYILGLAIPDGPPLGSAIVSKLDCFVTEVLVPLYVATSVLRTDLRKFKFDYMLRTDLILVIVTNVTKFVACLIACSFYQMPRLDSCALAFIMMSKGIVEVGLFTYYRDVNRIPVSTYNLMIISILTLSVTVPLFLKFLYDPARKYAGYQKRNIMHMKPDTELRILVCIHRPNDIPAMINLLDVSSPTKETPASVFVLHLIELIGRASPIFISHQIQKKFLSEVSYSQNVIVAFTLFENKNWSTVTVNYFTAISPYKLMHEDVCTLALDKLTSLLILPFHRKWSVDGTVEVDDNMARSLNLCVLERAPCSVGILVSRGYSGRAGSLLSSLESYMYSVCLIFLGGRDDREAVTYAKRMAKETSLFLTVIHFVASGENEVGNEMKWDIILDSEVLKDVKYSGLSGEQRIKYVQDVVNDGSEISHKLKALVDEFDLIIAGRSHSESSRVTSGLDLDWTEFPELGVIGDLLASANDYGRSSVLVIQQQATDDD